MGDLLMPYDYGNKKPKPMTKPKPKKGGKKK